MSQLRSRLEPRGLMSFAGGRVALLEGVVHHQDIRRALGRPRPIPPERLIVALQSALMAPDVGSFWRVRGVRLVATDLDFAWGRGPEVRGPGEALLMTIAGRTPAVEELAGPGQPRLAQRLADSAASPSDHRSAPPTSPGLNQHPGAALAPEQVERVYDRIGRLQDSQRLYEAPAVADLIAHAALPDARAVYEFGCGTGSLASQMLSGLDFDPAARPGPRRRMPAHRPHRPTCRLASGAQPHDRDRGHPIPGRRRPPDVRSRGRALSGSFETQVGDRRFESAMSRVLILGAGVAGHTAALRGPLRCCVP